MTDRRVLHGPGELLAALPALIGYTPRESVVIVGIGDRDELATVLRVDRQDLLHPEVATALGRGVAAQLSRASARTAMLVSFTDDDVRLCCPAADALRPALDGAVDEVEGWAVRRGRYFAPGCARESCCPASGRAVPRLPSIAGCEPEVRAGRHGALAAEPDAAYLVDEAARRRVARAAERWRARREANVDEWRRAGLRAWLAAVEQVRHDAYPSDPVAGRIIASLQDRRVRDAVLVSLIPGESEVAPRVLDGSADRDVAAALRLMLSPEEGRPPERGTVEPAWDLCAWLASRARVSARAPMLTLCAIIAWWEGDDDACRRLVARAHASEPGYRLAGLLECTLLAGIDPGWRRAA